MDVSRRSEKDRGRRAEIDERRLAEEDGRCRTEVDRGEEDEDKRRMGDGYKKASHSYLHHIRISNCYQTLLLAIIQA